MDKNKKVYFFLMFIKLILKLAFFLHRSKQYQNTKKLFYNFLQNPDYIYKRYFDSFMILLILVSVIILVYEVKNPVPIWIDDFDVYAVTSIFALEYILRFWVYNNFHSLVVKEYEEAKFLNKPFKLWIPLKIFLKDKLEYMISPSSIVDLLAILPAYRPLRVLRIFVLFRVFKLLRYTKSIHQFIEVFATKRFELVTLLLLLFFIVNTAGIAIYVFEERTNPNINSIFDAIYWALITISSVGYGDISPVTLEGRVVSMIIIISGIAMISFVTSVIVSAFSEKLDELKENRIVEKINKNRDFIIICGYGQMTRMFLRNNSLLSYEYVIIEKDIKRVEIGRKEGYSIINEDASRHDVISKFNINYSNIILLALTGSDINNIYITLNAKAISRNIKVIARANSENMEKKCRLAGVDYVVLPNMVANRMLLFAITQPAMYRAIYSILIGQNLAQLDEVSTVTHYKLVGKQIKDIDFKRHKLLFIGFQPGRKEKFIFNPPPQIDIRIGDVLLVLGRKVSIEYFKQHYGEVYYE
jgi:voltage-gated potassium channel